MPIACPALSQLLHQQRPLLFVLRMREVTQLWVLLPALMGVINADAQTTLADSPIFAATTASVPSNVALALSVEWPTASRAAYPGTNDYSSANTYRGYFDASKCYAYQYSASENNHFAPSAVAVNRTCSSAWSGNFLNWAATQAIDPFRLVMTGGNRSIDTAEETILQKAWHSGQGDLYPNKILTNSATIAGATPFNWANLRIRIDGAGFAMIFSGTNVTGNPNDATPYGSVVAMDAAATYSASVRVKVCDPAAPGGVEDNCRRYGNNYKPEGLIQHYSESMRFSAFGYLNEDGNQRHGGVMRAPMKFVGPYRPVPGQPSEANTAAQEWDPATGVFTDLPDAITDVATSNTNYGTIAQASGVSNYLNKFGQIFTGNYKSNDPVGELYYAVTRYFKNQGNIAGWSNITGVDAAGLLRRLDGFPVITDWDDPIQYSCQRNFILGIGDVYTHADKNVPGNTNTADEPGMLALNDNSVDAVAATNIVGRYQGLGASYGTATNVSSGCCSNNAALMAGIAFHSNTTDIRPGNAINTRNRQTIQTFWVDVLEAPFLPNNQFYLATKYGGLLPPSGTTLDYANPPTTIPQSWWSTTGETVGAGPAFGSGGTTQPRPDNYFTAGSPDQMISGLTRAFDRINTLGASFTTSFALPAPQVSGTGNLSFSASYDADGWIGELSANLLSFNAETGAPIQTNIWNASATLDTQVATPGWNTGRRVVTWVPAASGIGGTGATFRTASLSTGQLVALDTGYVAGDDSSSYLNYLRGDRGHERAEANGAIPTTNADLTYRLRRHILGDIVGSRVLAVGPPSSPYSDAHNPGYSDFKIANATRPVVAYVGANDGMLHAFRAQGTNAGNELFAYVPNALFNGPSTPATPGLNGLAAIGNPNYVHRNFVNATPVVFDVDVNRIWNSGNTAASNVSADWRSILIGGLGKGGRSYYAIDVTTPPSEITSEETTAHRVLWEISPPGMGYTFGEAIVVKTRKYGWTVVLPSGYNTPAIPPAGPGNAGSPAGRAYIYFVNPLTGEVYERIAVGTGGSPTNDAGLAQINAYTLDRTDGYADAVYAGDLIGNLWRVDITGSRNYASPANPLARLTDNTGNAQPVTTRVRIALDPNTRERWVLVGTGRLLDTTDTASTQQQTFYAIRDGNQTRFFSERVIPPAPSSLPELPPSVTGFPLRRNADLLGVAETQLSSGITLPADVPMGWYHDLGFATDTGSVARRVIVDGATFQGIFAFATTLPSITDPCSPSGTSRVYAVDFSTGRSSLSQSLAYQDITTGSVTNLQFLAVDGNVRLVAGTDRGGIEPVKGPAAIPVGLRRLNWREIPITN